ncbi:hypothetical protein NVT87_08485 [Acinetobacter radioresistens]|uniref:hypothetical protein n=1 Tax=Acinetobacter radioresistens TaxID=40216 RepID=UPI002246533F|nr:hypothetical protein [Acinetobacter radioresistens]MCX0330920.1 hypothetical protein [Acinetobacter radioresistens]
MHTIGRLEAINCGFGVVAHRSANVQINSSYFEKVHTCFHIYDDLPYRLNRSDYNASKSAKLTADVMKPAQNSGRQHQPILKSLFNLEVSAKIKKNKKLANKIKELRSCIFSKEFEQKLIIIKSESI